MEVQTRASIPKLQSRGEKRVMHLCLDVRESYVLFCVNYGEEVDN